MKKESIKKFVKEHKTEIIIGTVGIISSAALGVIGVKMSKKPNGRWTFGPYWSC